MRFLPVFVVFTGFILSSCENSESDPDVYDRNQVGVVRSVNSCDVVSARVIEIGGGESDGQKLARRFVSGAVGAAVVGDGGLDSLIGAGIGIAIGEAAAQGMNKGDTGIEYQVAFANGSQAIIIQDIRKGDILMGSGDPCIVQSYQGRSARVLPAN